MKPLTRLFCDAREHFSRTETLRRYHVVQAAIRDLYMRGFNLDDGNKRIAANKMSRRAVIALIRCWRDNKAPR